MPSAADRFRAAARDRDPFRAAAEFAEDIRLYNPFSAEPLVGRDAVAGALARLDEIFDDFTHLRVLSDADPAGGAVDVQGVVFQARIGDQIIEGIDLLEVNDDDKIATFTVLARPLAALQALGRAMTQSPPPQ